MAQDGVALPKAFEFEGEGVKFLQGLKKRAGKNFSLTRMDALYQVHDLAFALYVYGRREECEEVCAVAARVEFSGNFNLWSPVETTLALWARVLRERGALDLAAVQLDRVRAAGFVADRLKGLLLCDDKIQEAVQEGDKTSERDYRLGQFSELCFMKELGGSQAYPVEKLEGMIQENLDALRKLLKIV